MHISPLNPNTDISFFDLKASSRDLRFARTNSHDHDSPASNTICSTSQSLQRPIFNSPVPKR